MSNRSQTTTSYEADNIYQSLEKLSAQVDTSVSSLKGLQCQQEQGVRKLDSRAGQFDGLPESPLLALPSSPPFTGEAS